MTIQPPPNAIFYALAFMPNFVPIASITARILRNCLRAFAPFWLTPVGFPTVISPGSAEVASTAAEIPAAFGIDNGTTGIAVTDNLRRSRRGCWRLFGKRAVTKPVLAAGTTINALILNLCPKPPHQHLFNATITSGEL